MGQHWHVASGIVGYGPDPADDGFATLHTVHEIADAVRYELDSYADAAHDFAEQLAGDGDFESAWREHKRSEELGTLVLNLDPARTQAPLYRNDPARWEQTLWTLLGELPLDVSDLARLYLWECSEDECEDGE